MDLTFTTVGIAALVIALVVMWRHNWTGSRFTVILMLLGGAAITTASGAVRNLLMSGGEWLGGFASAGTSQLFGIGIPALLVIGMAVWVVVDLKDRSIHPATPWIALVLPTMLTVIGGVAIGADLLSWVTSAGTV